jgi:hypothetical protein
MIYEERTASRRSIWSAASHCDGGRAITAFFWEVSVA